MQWRLRASACQGLGTSSWRSHCGLRHLLRQSGPSIVSKSVCTWRSWKLLNFIRYCIFRNSGARVIGKQTEHHANIYAAARALQSLPKDLFKKVCICTDSMRVVQAMSRLLPQWSENDYRLLSDPTRRCENLPTLHALNEYVRLNPFTYRFKYTPSDCNIPMMVIATKLAKSAASE